MSAFLSLQRSRRGGASRFGRIAGGAAAAALLSSVLVSAGAGAAEAAAGNEATELLAQIEIPNAGDVRGSVYLPPEIGGFAVDWESSDPALVSDVADGDIAAGVVTRPTNGEPAVVTLTACTTVVYIHGCRDIQLTVRPAVGELADPKGYGMVTFQNSASEKIYGATSVGNDALTWEATNGGDPMFTSNLGSTGLRDPSIVRSPEGDKYYMVATDLWTQDPQFNAKGGWGWAQTGGSRAIEIWESDDLKTWSNQRHVDVNTSPETGMTFAPEAIWDPETQQYVVYWSSAIYADGTYYTTDPNDPNRRATDSLKWGRNVTYYVTTRDFVHFSESKRMYDRCGTDGCAWDKGFGNLDPMIVFNPDDGYYYRAVQDRWDKIFERLYPDCAQTTTDLYIERSTSILAPAEDWELLGGCLTIDAINGAGLGTASYNEGPNMVKANPGDVNGQGFYLMADGGWTGTDGTRHQGLQPYFATDIASGEFAASLKWNPPLFTGQRAPRAAHGHVFAATAAEHAAFRGADLEALTVKTPPAKTTYVAGESLDLAGLELAATYSDGEPGIEITEGFGGYTVSGYDPNTAGAQQVTVSFTVTGVTKTATFDVLVTRADPSVQVTATTRCATGRVVLATTVTNTTDGEVSVDVHTPHGDKRAVIVPAGASANQLFATRQAEIAAGSVAAVVGPAAAGAQAGPPNAGAAGRSWRRGHSGAPAAPGGSGRLPALTGPDRLPTLGVPGNTRDASPLCCGVVFGEDDDLGRRPRRRFGVSACRRGAVRLLPAEDLEMMMGNGASFRVVTGVVGGLLLVGVGGAAFAEYPDPSGGSDVEVSVEIAPVEHGALSLTVDAGATSLSEADSTAQYRRFTGKLPNVTVTDTRTEVPAGVFWYVTGQASDFAGSAGQAGIPADHLGWTPAMVGPANSDDVIEGPQVDTSLDPVGPNNVGLGGEELLALNLTDSQSAAVAGQWTANADLVLKTPVEVAPGSYTSTLTLSLFEDAL